MKKHFMISVIILVHNTEKYLEDTIRSMLYQTFDFEQKIQLIIVSVCSDGISEQIYKKYKVLYPENIVYVCLDKYRSENVGRNAGMKYAVGKYINFLDAGNMWSLNAFEKAADFFETCGEDIDLICADTEMIEAVKEENLFNRKLAENKIIDMNEQYSGILYRSSSCIMRMETVQKYSFDEQQKCWGDLLLINQVMLRRQKYGMLSSRVVHYRHARDQVHRMSGVDCQQDLRRLLEGIYQESMNRSGCLLPIIQYLAAFVLGEFFQWTIALSVDERKRCDDVLAELLQHIDDRYLLEAKYNDGFVSKALTAFKHGVDIRDEINRMQRMELRHQDLYQRFDRMNRNYGVLQQWFLSLMQGTRLSDYFIRNSYQNIAVYGMADLGRFLILELRSSRITVKYGIDRRAETISAEIPVFTLEDELPSVDAVVVTAVYYFNQIADSLRDRLECPVISIEDVLYSIP